MDKHKSKNKSKDQDDNSNKSKSKSSNVNKDKNRKNEKGRNQNKHFDSSDSQPTRNLGGGKRSFHGQLSHHITVICIISCLLLNLCTACTEMKTLGIHNYDTPFVAMLEEGEIVVPIVIDLNGSYRVCNTTINNKYLSDIVGLESL